MIKIDGKLVDWREDGLTDQQVQRLYEQDTKWARDAALDLVRVPLSPNEMEAVVSLIYNTGVGLFKRSQALKALNRGDRDEFVRQAFDSQICFTKATNPKTGKKEILPGLVRRRAAEANLFLGV